MRDEPMPKLLRRRRQRLGIRAPPRAARGPCVSGNPNMRFMFCTAWPAAPFTRLSSTARTTRVSRIERPVHGDAALVRAAHPARLGLRARRQHVDERLGCVALLEERLEIRVLRDARVDRREDAAHHRHQVRHEGEAQLAARRALEAREALQDLGMVAMALHRVGLEVVGSPRRRADPSRPCAPRRSRPTSRRRSGGDGRCGRSPRAAAARAAPPWRSSRDWRRGAPCGCARG